MIKNEGKVVLASNSPRRRELIRSLFPDFDVITADTDESLPEGVTVREGACAIAERKGRAVADIVGKERLIISSDTIVELDGTPLGKPRDELDAVRMLSSLSGRTHSVHTGVAVHYKGRVYSGVETTLVTFKPLSAEQILEYVRSGEPMDKAGSYGIQGGGGKFVLSYDGDFDTVMGLSMKLTERLVAESGYFYGK